MILNVKVKKTILATAKLALVTERTEFHLLMSILITHIYDSFKIIILLHGFVKLNILYAHQKIFVHINHFAILNVFLLFFFFSPTVLNTLK